MGKKDSTAMRLNSSSAFKNEVSLRKTYNRADIFFYFITCIIVFRIIWTLENEGIAKSYVMAGFILNGLISFAILFTDRNSVTIRKTIYIFIFVFLVLAAMSQYLSKTVFWVAQGLNITFDSTDYAKANMIVLLFIVMFEIGYKSIGTKVRFKIKQNTFSISKKTSRYTPQLLLLVSTINLALMLLLHGFAFLRTNNFAVGYILTNTIYLITPICCTLFVILMRYREYKDKIIVGAILFVELGTQVLLFNQLMPRNLSLGGIMAVVCSILYGSKYKSIYCFGYLFGFTTIFTNFSRRDLRSISLKTLIDGKGLNYVDFEGFQEIMTVIKYVEEQGFDFGNTMLSTLLCFIPRSINSFKSIGTETVTSLYFGNTMTNVSEPIMSEFYFAFGIVGVIVFSAIFGNIVRRIDEFPIKDSPFLMGLFCITCGYTIYLTRGAMLSTFTFYFGIIFGYFLICKIVRLI